MFNAIYFWLIQDKNTVFYDFQDLIFFFILNNLIQDCYNADKWLIMQLKIQICAINQHSIIIYCFKINMNSNSAYQSAFKSQLTQNPEIDQSSKRVSFSPLIHNNDYYQQGNNHLGGSGEKVKKQSKKSEQKNDIEQCRRIVSNCANNQRQQKQQNNFQKIYAPQKSNVGQSKLTQKKRKQIQKKSILKQNQNIYINLISQQEDPEIQEENISKKHRNYQKKQRKAHQKEQARQVLNRQVNGRTNCNGFGQTFFRLSKGQIKNLDSDEGLQTLLSYFRSLRLPQDCPEYLFVSQEDLSKQLKQLIKQILRIIHAGGCKKDVKLLFDQINKIYFHYMYATKRRQGQGTVRMIYMQTFPENFKNIQDIKIRKSYKSQNLARYVITQFLCDYFDKEIKYEPKNVQKKLRFIYSMRIQLQAMRQNRPIPTRVKQQMANTQLIQTTIRQEIVLDRVPQNVHNIISSERLNVDSNLINLMMENRQRERQRDMERQREREREMEMEIQNNPDVEQNNNALVTADSVIQSTTRNLFGINSRNQSNLNIYDNAISIRTNHETDIERQLTFNFQNEQWLAYFDF